MKHFIKQQFNKLNPALLKLTFTYSFSGFFSAGIYFLLLPVLTRYLTQYDYGIIETFLSITTLLTGVVLLGGNTLLAKEYFNLDGQARKNYIENILRDIFVSTAFVLVIFLLSVCLNNFLASLLKVENILILSAIGVSFCSAVIAVLLTLWQLERNAKPFFVFINSQAVVDIVISLILIVVLSMNYKGRIAGITVSNVLFFIFALLIFRKRNIKLNSLLKLRNVAFVSVFPLVAAHISGWAMEMSDRLMINNILDVKSTGIYSVGCRFGMLVILVQEALNKVWFPFFYENVRKEDRSANIRIVKVTYVYAGGLVIFSLLLGLFGKHLLCLFVDRKFYAAGDFIFLISIAYCVYGIWKIFIGYLIYCERIKTYSGIVFISAAANITLNFVLLRQIGLMGAAWAAFISFTIGCVLTIIFAVKNHPMPWLGR